MKTMAAISAFGAVAAFFCIMMITTSCGSGDNGREVATDIESDLALSRDAAYDDQFNRIVSGVYRDPDGRTTLKVIGDLCDEICKLPKEDSLALLDSFASKAINAQVSSEDFRLREVWFEQLFDVVYVAFNNAQYMQQDSFEHWDVLFSFFAKCNGEITSVQEGLPATDSSSWKQTDWDKGRYLYGIREKYKTWVRVMRDAYFPKLNGGLTKEQKSDILRRFNELERYTITPDNFPGRKK